MINYTTEMYINIFGFPENIINIYVITNKHFKFKHLI